jgi:hypothetical protein
MSQNSSAAWRPTAHWVAQGISLLLCLITALNVGAQTVFTVNDDADTVDADTADGKCSTAAGKCTLRAAVMQANRMANLGATIMLPAGVYQLGAPVNSDGEESGDLNLLIPSGAKPGATNIIGAGSAATIIDGQGSDRVFNITGARQVSISKVSIINGSVPSGNGGAILNSGGNLALSDCAVANNTALGSKGNGYGGGVDSNGPLSINGCVFDGNHASTEGGAVHSAASLIVNNSRFSANSSGAGGGISSANTLSASLVTIIGNTATSFGGGLLTSGSMANLDLSEVIGNTVTGSGAGIVVVIGATLNITRTTIAGNSTSGIKYPEAYGSAGIRNQGVLFMSNSTVADNQASGDAGGIGNRGTANVYNSTIAFNEADSDADDAGDGAGLYVYAGTLNVRNSVVAGNYLAGQQAYHDCFGVIGVYGNNKFSGMPGCTVNPVSSGTASFVGSLDELGILKDNGGPTLTVALVPPSTMVGGAVKCLDQNAVPLQTDQRGRQRPPSATCDIGAFEYNELFRSGFDPSS